MGGGAKMNPEFRIQNPEFETEQKRNFGKTRGLLEKIKESRRKGYAHGIEVERGPRAERLILQHGKREVTDRPKHLLLRGITLIVEPIHP
jgi:hypothetical protein